MYSIKMDRKMLFIILMAIIPMTKEAIPGTFYWRPRLGLDLAIPTTEVTMLVASPTKDNVKLGLVVLVDGYQAGLTIVALAAGVTNAQAFPHMNPLSGYFYTNAYRWALRHMSLLPFWLGGNKGSYCDTHKVWRRRFFYMDELIPKPLRYLFPYIKKEEWDKEELEVRRYKKYSESAFGKYYRYPSRHFRNFTSLETTETVEEVDLASSEQID